MRFALIGPTYPYRGGIAHHTTLLVRALRDAGHEALFISFSRQYPAFLFPGKDDRDPSAHPLTADAEYLLDSVNPWTWRQVVQRVAAWQPDAVVLPWWVPFWAPHWAVIGRAVKRLAFRPKLLFICHNVLPHEPGRLDRLALRVALSPGDGYIAHSQADAAQLRANLSAPNVVVTPLPTFAALGGHSAETTPDLFPADRNNLLFCGLIRPYKGLDILLDALPAVIDRHPTTHLTVVGEMWDNGAGYQAQIARLGLASHITLRDEYVENATLAAYLRAASVVVLPYRSATQSAIVQAAFGQGTPVITTAVGGLAEAVEDGVTGLVVLPERADLLAGAIGRYIEYGHEPAFRHNIQLRQSQFSWDHTLAALTTLAQHS